MKNFKIKTFGEYNKIYEKALDASVEELKKFQTDLNINTNIKKLLDSIEAIPLKLSTIFPSLKNENDIDDVINDKAFLDEIDKRKFKTSEVFNTEDSATLIKAPFKYIWIYTIDSTQLDLPVYMLLQYYIMRDSKWSEIKLYNVQKDLQNFYDELSSITLEIRDKNNKNNKWIYTTSNSGENWKLKNTDNATTTFKTSLEMKDIENMASYSNIEMVFY